MSRFFFLVVLIFVCQNKAIHSQAVMGIDFGGEFIKTSVVTLSKPIETVLDRDSARKTPAYIGVKDERIFFAETAKNMYRRNPESVVRNIDQLLGRYFDDPSIVEYRKMNPYLDMTKDPETGGIVINFQKSNMSFTPVELLCLWLNEIRDFTSAFLDYEIADALLIFDPTVDQARADAVLAASRLSSLNLLETTDTPRALVTQFVVLRKKFLTQAPMVVMFVDVGAENTVATIARVRIENGSKPNVTIPSFVVLGVGYANIGASNYDDCIKKFLMEEFQKKHKITKDLSKDHKVDYKFTQEVVNVKRTLTASKEARVTVEDAYDFQTFQTVFKRTQMEELCAHVTDKIGKAIDDAFGSAGMTNENISDVVLMGGGSLIPIVQELIQTKTKRTPSRVLNTDETNAAGGSILAAKIHKLFRVAEIHTPPSVYYAIEIEYTVNINGSDGQSSVRHQKEVLFPHMSRQSSKRVLTIPNVTDDFTVRVRYASQPEYVNTEKLDYRDIMDVHITGLKELIDNHSTYQVKHLVTHFKLNSHKILTITKVELFMENNVSQGLLGKMSKVVRNMLGMDEKNNQTETDSDDEVEHLPQTNLTYNNSTEANETVPEVAKQKAEQNISLPVPYKISVLYFKPPSEEEFEKSSAKLKLIYYNEKLRNLNAQARSDLEGFIYKVEQSIESKQWEGYSKEEEMLSIANVTQVVKAWYEGHGHVSNYTQLNAKITEIRSLIKPIQERIEEEKDREQKVAVLRDSLNQTQNVLLNSFNRPDLMQHMNNTLFQHILNSTMDMQTWLNEKLSEQSLLKPYDPPALTLGMLRRKFRELEELSTPLYADIRKAMAEVSKTASSKPKNTTQSSNETTTAPTEATTSPPAENVTTSEQGETKSEL